MKEIIKIIFIALIINCLSFGLLGLILSFEDNNQKDVKEPVYLKVTELNTFLDSIATEDYEKFEYLRDSGLLWDLVYERMGRK